MKILFWVRHSIVDNAEKFVYIGWNCVLELLLFHICCCFCCGWWSRSSLSLSVICLSCSVIIVGLYLLMRHIAYMLPFHLCLSWVLGHFVYLSTVVCFCFFVRDLVFTVFTFISMSSFVSSDESLSWRLKIVSGWVEICCCRSFSFWCDGWCWANLVLDTQNSGFGWTHYRLLLFCVAGTVSVIRRMVVIMLGISTIDVDDAFIIVILVGCSFPTPDT